MSFRKLFALALLAFLFPCCKASQPNGPTFGSTPSLVEVTMLLDTIQGKFFDFADQTDGDPRQALELTANWTATQLNVASAQALDSTYIEIVMKSGQDTAHPATDGTIWGGIFSLYYATSATGQTESLQSFDNSCRCVKDP